MLNLFFTIPSFHDVSDFVGMDNAMVDNGGDTSK
jgi:hypothetical protein